MSNGYIVEKWYTPVGECELCNSNPCTCLQKKCDHDNVIYQEKEFDTNVPEMVYCEDCNEELPLPEPDYEIDLLMNGYDGDDRNELIEKNFKKKE